MGDFTENLSELIPIYGTYLIGKRFVNNPSWKGAGELALSAAGDAALLTGVGAGVGAALKAGNAAVKAGKVAKTANTLRKVGAARELSFRKPIGKTFHDVASEQYSNLVDNAIISGQKIPEQVYQKAMSNFTRAGNADVAVGELNKGKGLFELGVGASGSAKSAQNQFGKYKNGNKLVSRNPVLRFKEGKKLLIKALGGVKTSAPVLETIGRYVREKNRSLFGSGWRWYDTQAPVGRRAVSLDKEIELDGWILKPDGTKVSASLRNKQQSTPIQSTPSATTSTTQQTPLPNGAFLQPQRRPVARRTPSPVFYGTKAGGQVTNGLGTITPELKAQLIGTGQFSDADFASTKSLQTALNKYFAGDNAGSIKVDNLWGNQTQKAFNLALAKSKAPQIVGGSAPNPTVISSQTPETLQAPLISLPQITVPQKTFNRSEIRLYMRDKGVNPYSFTGDLRKALRMVMNGSGTDEDKAMVKEMGLFKKGGNILPSRNPVTRFKMRMGGGICKFFLNGGTVTSLKTVLKFLKGTNSSWKIDWSKQTPVGLELTDKVVQLVKNVTQPIEEHTAKAAKRNKNTTALQLQLWNSGAFKGVINKRTGKLVTYKEAVDGMMGSTTRQAMENNKKKREAIPLSPEEKPKSTRKPNSLAAMRETTHAARTGGMNSTPQLNLRSENFERLVRNVVKNPIKGSIDAAFYTADRLGIPSNATNYIRDLNVSIPYRIAAASRAGVETLYNGNNYSENYENALANPNILLRFGTIEPLINRNKNFTKEQLQVIKDMAGKKGYITNADIKRVSENGRYGAGEEGINKYFSPTKVVQTAIGRSSGNNGVLTDYFDVNTLSEEAQRDNEAYLNNLKEGKYPLFSYGALRATMPYTSSIDIMPDKYKIKTVIDLNK